MVQLDVGELKITARSLLDRPADSGTISQGRNKVGAVGEERERNGALRTSEAAV